jgi:predicted NAD/FAD-dependent oxidoreductase
MHRNPVYLGGVWGSNAAVVEMKRETPAELEPGLEQELWKLVAKWRYAAPHNSQILETVISACADELEAVINATHDPH